MGLPGLYRLENGQPKRALEAFNEVQDQDLVPDLRSRIEAARVKANLHLGQ